MSPDLSTTLKRNTACVVAGTGNRETREQIIDGMGLNEHVRDGLRTPWDVMNVLGVDVIKSRDPVLLGLYLKQRYLQVTWWAYAFGMRGTLGKETESSTSTITDSERTIFRNTVDMTIMAHQIGNISASVEGSSVKDGIIPEGYESFGDAHGRAVLWYGNVSQTDSRSLEQLAKSLEANFNGTGEEYERAVADARDIKVVAIKSPKGRVDLFVGFDPSFAIQNGFEPGSFVSGELGNSHFYGAWQ